MNKYVNLVCFMVILSVMMIGCSSYEDSTTEESSALESVEVRAEQSNASEIIEVETQESNSSESVEIDADEKIVEVSIEEWEEIRAFIRSNTYLEPEDYPDGWTINDLGSEWYEVDESSWLIVNDSRKVFFYKEGESKVQLVSREKLDFSASNFSEDIKYYTDTLYHGTLILCDSQLSCWKLNEEISSIQLQYSNLSFCPNIGTSRIILYNEDGFLGWYDTDEEILVELASDYIGNPIVEEDESQESLDSWKTIETYGVSYVMYVNTSGELVFINEITNSKDVLYENVEKIKNIDDANLEVITNKGNVYFFNCFEQWLIDNN